MARPHERPARLNLHHSIHMQQPQALFSPALPTGIQAGFHPPPFPVGGNPLQTPMQPFFHQGPPQAPGRPTHQSRNSIAHFPGPQQPNGFVTPVTGHFPRPSMMVGNGQPFLNPNAPHRPHKRQMSIGGPPKAVLGGPARKVSPNPIAVAAAAAVSKKKIVVNLPKETIKTDGEGEEVQGEGEPQAKSETTRAEFARIPLPPEEYEDVEVEPPDLVTGEIFPPDDWVKEWPESIDVFLPRKETWDILKQQVIEAKLEKLGVERGSGSNIPHIFAPHARAASISSPADPALLLFKLNKLQASQQSSANNSLAPSPQLPNQPFGLSPSPNQRRPSPGNLFQLRHGHTMSLAQPPSFVSPGAYDPTTSSFNPFASGGASVDGDRPKSAVSDSGLGRPQSEFDVPSIGRVDSRPDFIRGFGLDIPEEEEPEEEDDNPSITSEQDDGNAGDTEEEAADRESEEDVGADGVMTAAQSRLHSRHGSRHVSRVSAALSLKSVGGNHGAILPHPEGYVPPEREEDTSDYEDVAAVQEWTGSEEEGGYNGTETSDDESLGEFSNPSDEERARRQRVERRMRRRAVQDRPGEILQVQDQPRRIPNFPRPPDSLDLVYVPTQREDLPDDIISNPSEEDLDMHRGTQHHPHYLGLRNGPGGDFYVPRSSSGTISPRHLPPLPHSRGSSHQYSIHDPAMAHSRNPSQASYYPNQNPLFQQHSPRNSLSASASASGRKDSLNPFAKPFVFGKPLSQDAQKPATPEANTSSSHMSHSRGNSLAKPLNVAAPEFKPRGLPSSAEFTFRQPDAPQMPVPPPGFPEPAIPQDHVEDSFDASPAFRTQGREKRLRLGSTESAEVVEEGDSMSSFRFPAAGSESPRKHRNSDSGTHPLAHRIQPSDAPFSFEAFSNVAHFPTIRPTVSEVDGDGEVSMEMDEEDEAEATKENIPPPPRLQEDHDTKDEEEGQEFTLPPLSATKPKRAPLPLDFKHKTVPAGLFKALVNTNGDDRTRRGVRSRLGSREIFEHINRPSMDDSNVQMISRGHRMVTDPIKRSSSAGEDDVFSSGLRHERRRSSLPDALRDDLSSPPSAVSSVPPQDLTSRLEAQHISDVLAQMLDTKFTSLRRELLAITRESQANISQSGLNPASEEMISDVVSLFRTQLQDSAARSLEDSQLDARGEMDFQMVKDLIDDGNKEILYVVKQEIHDTLAQQQPGIRTPQDNRAIVQEVVAPIVESVGDRTTRAVVEAISEFSARQDALECGTPARERDLLLNDIVNVLTPVLNGLRTEPIDYDFLTTQLAQAVKPHISQLIDLASDKRETAAIIIEQLLPLLPSLKGETEAMSVHIVNEVRRAIAPIDPFEIREQVADLVVERLDSRLTVRDKAFNVDTVTAKVTDGVSQLLEDLNKVPATLEKFFAAQDKDKANWQAEEKQQQELLLCSVTDVSTKLESQFDQIRISQGEVVGKVEQVVASASKSDSTVAELKPLLEALIAENKTLANRNADLLAHQQALATKVNTLPEILQSNIVNLQNGIAELITSRDVPKRDLDDLRKLNSDYQIQLTKARAAHGQVRVEKDVMSEKLAAIEAEREKFKKRVAELEGVAATKASEKSTLEARVTELEEALSKALARLQEADVATHADKKRIAELEKTVKDSTAESQSMNAKLETLELQVKFANRDKEVATEALEAMKKQHDAFVTQQSHWDDLRQASDKIDMLTQLIGQADNEELHDLRRYRERTKPLETEHAALQKRFKELESKAANSERVATTAKQSLAQAQQRSAEWERRAREYEGELELTKTKLEQAEQTQSQLDADYSLLRIQFEEREADERLNQDREQKRAEQMKALEAKVVRLQEELLKARASRPPPSRLSSYSSANSNSPSPYRTNGSSLQHPPRPDSRGSASTVNTINGRDAPGPDRRMSSYTPSSNGGTPQSSVWDSMHAPSSNNSTYGNGAVGASIHAPTSRYPHLGPSTPKSRYPSHFSRANAPSPSPSVASAAPTLGDDGWYS